MVNREMNGNASEQLVSFCFLMILLNLRWTLCWLAESTSCKEFVFKYLYENIVTLNITLPMYITNSALHIVHFTIQSVLNSSDKCLSLYHTQLTYYSYLICFTKPITLTGSVSEMTHSHTTRNPRTIFFFGRFKQNFYISNLRQCCLYFHHCSDFIFLYIKKKVINSKWFT